MAYWTYPLISCLPKFFVHLFGQIFAIIIEMIELYHFFFFLDQIVINVHLRKENGKSWKTCAPEILELHTYRE